eukprot:Lankesteria_metandrocarpae@DN3528_c0_g1_i1.p1
MLVHRRPPNNGGGSDGDGVAELRHRMAALNLMGNSDSDNVRDAVIHHQQSSVDCLRNASGALRTEAVYALPKTNYSLRFDAHALQNSTDSNPVSRVSSSYADTLFRRVNSSSSRGAALQANYHNSPNSSRGATQGCPLPDAQRNHFATVGSGEYSNANGTGPRHHQPHNILSNSNSSTPNCNPTSVRSSTQTDSTTCTTGTQYSTTGTQYSTAGVQYSNDEEDIDMMPFTPHSYTEDLFVTGGHTGGANSVSHAYTGTSLIGYSTALIRSVTSALHSLHRYIPFGRSYEHTAGNLKPKALSVTGGTYIDTKNNNSTHSSEKTYDSATPLTGKKHTDFDCRLATGTGTGTGTGTSDLLIYENETASRRRREWRQFWGVLPFMFNAYLQSFFNTVLVGLVIYCVMSFVFSLQEDIKSRIARSVQEEVNEASHCASEFRRNRCFPGERVPALEATCLAWESCMKKDPDRILQRSRVVAQTVGETVNTFLEQLSWKSASLMAAGFLVIFVGSNFAFAFARGPTTSSDVCHNNNTTGKGKCRDGTDNVPPWYYGRPKLQDVKGSSYGRPTAVDEDTYSTDALLRRLLHNTPSQTRCNSR